MTAKGHVMLATTGILLVESQTRFLANMNLVDATIIVLAYLIGALFPDIDESESYIGNKLKIFSVVFSLFVQHRTITHYFILPLFIAIIGYSFFVPFSVEQLTIYAFAAGILMHDMGDMLTKGGIVGFFFPLFSDTRVGLLPRALRFKTFSMQEYALIVFILMPLNIYLATVCLRGLI